MQAKYNESSASYKTTVMLYAVDVFICLWISFDLLHLAFAHIVLLLSHKFLVLSYVHVPVLSRCWNS